MARFRFDLGSVISPKAGVLYRVDTASGSSTPATVYGDPDSSAALDPRFRALVSGGVGQLLPPVWGPDGVTTLYLKELTPEGAVTGSATTVTGRTTGGGTLTAADAFSPLQLAADPESMATGAITRGTALGAVGLPTGFAVAWPDGATGVYAGTESAVTPGAIDTYTVTRVTSSGTKTYTQPTVTRNPTSGLVTNRPAMTVA